MPSRLRNLNFASVVEALIDYAVDGGTYSFESTGEGKKLVITISVDDRDAYSAKHLAALGKMFDAREDVAPGGERMSLHRA